MISRKELVAQAKELGLHAGDVVMMHASMRAIGKVLGGPDEVHQAIIDVIGPEGTLCMYVGCEKEFEIIGRNELSFNEAEFILANCPVFNSTTARARRDYGILAEFFRSWPQVVSSENPGARVAAFGKKAKELTRDHPLNYGYGPGSPLAKLLKNKAKILLLGSDLDQVTILHLAEHLASIEPKRVVKFKVPLLKNNQRAWVEVEEYDTAIGIRQWPNRFFETIIRKFIHDQQISTKKLGHADSYLLDAQSLVNFAVNFFEQSANKYSL